MTPDKSETCTPSGRKAWRQWLQKHHAKKQFVWLVYYKKKTSTSSLTWSEAVDEALCFGWIDSKRIPVDEDTFMQYFSRRKPSSAWSKINKEKVERLAAEGLMTEAGLKCIQLAKENGSWTMLDAAENLEIPDDLEKEFRRNHGSKSYFLSLSKSVQKIHLQQLVFAKREETRLKRIQAIVALAAIKSK